MVLKELLLLLKACDIFLIPTVLDDKRKVLVNLGCEDNYLRKSGVHGKSLHPTVNHPITRSEICYTNVYGKG